MKKFNFFIETQKFENERILIEAFEILIILNYFIQTHSRSMVDLKIFLSGGKGIVYNIFTHTKKSITSFYNVM